MIFKKLIYGFGGRGGTAGQIAVKNSARDYDITWIDNPMAPQASQTIANNQVAPANITGLLFDSASISMAEIIYSIHRETNTNLAVEGGSFKVLKGATWSCSGRYNVLGAGGVSFDIDGTTGQVTYTSSNITGTLVKSVMKYKIISLGV